jgi:hypothetical protein
MRFDERMIREDQVTAVARLAAETNSLPGDAIEVGVWQGRSAIPIANAVYPGILHAVDNWLGSEDDPEAVAAGVTLVQASGVTPEQLARDNHGIFLQNLEEGTRGNVRVHGMNWREFAAQWEGPVRFLHIDATHTATEVADNIAAFLPYAVPGAVFAGDDYSDDFPGVIEGVHRHFPHARRGPGVLWQVTI